MDLCAKAYALNRRPNWDLNSNDTKVQASLTMMRQYLFIEIPDLLFGYVIGYLVSFFLLTEH